MDGETLELEVHDRKATARDAMDRYASRFERPRKVAGVDGCWFYLEGGMCWHRVAEADHGWNVYRTEKLV